MTEVKNNNYKKALVEVEAVLSCLNYMDYKKYHKILLRQ